MNAASFDKSRKLVLYARIGEIGNTITLTFLNADGSGHDISSYNFKFKAKARPFSLVNFFELSIGSGLSISGASNHKLNITPNATQASQIPDTNFWTLYSDLQGLTWLNGPLVFHNGEFDGVEPTGTITVSSSGSEVTISITSLNTDTRVQSVASTATLTPNVDSYDMAVITAQSEALLIANPTGTPNNGDHFIIRLKDNGVARTITFGANYRAIGITLPTTTVVNKTMYIGCKYNSTDTKIDIIALSQEA